MVMTVIKVILVLNFSNIPRIVYYSIRLKYTLALAPNAAIFYIDSNNIVLAITLVL
jgi:hypothetical protein